MYCKDATADLAYHGDKLATVEAADRTAANNDDDERITGRGEASEVDDDALGLGDSGAAEVDEEEGVGGSDDERAFWGVGRLTRAVSQESEARGVKWTDCVDERRRW